MKRFDILVKCHPDYMYERIDFDIDGDDLLITFYRNGVREYVHKNDRGDLVIDFANPFQPLRCKNFINKTPEEIINRHRINFGPHFIDGIREAQDWVRKNRNRKRK